MTPRELTLPLQSLPPILYIMFPNPIPSYSKGSRGLSVLLRVAGVFTGITISPSPSLRQCPSRYAIRAGRNLPDKEFRSNLLLPSLKYLLVNLVNQLMAGWTFLPTSLCRHRVRTISSPKVLGVWRIVSEDSRSNKTDLVFPADYLHRAHFHRACRRSTDIRLSSR